MAEYEFMSKGRGVQLSYKNLSYEDLSDAEVEQFEKAVEAAGRAGLLETREELEEGHEANYELGMVLGVTNDLDELKSFMHGTELYLDDKEVLE
jgi:hypothetical protein